LSAASDLLPFLAPSLLAGFQARHPEVAPRFVEDSQLNLEHAMLAGNIDLSIVYDFDISPGFERVRLYDAEAYILVSPRHRLGNTTAPVDLALFGDDPFIQIDVLPGRNDHLFAAIASRRTSSIGRRISNSSALWSPQSRLCGAGSATEKRRHLRRAAAGHTPDRQPGPAADGRPRLAGQPALHRRVKAFADSP